MFSSLRARAHIWWIRGRGLTYESLLYKIEDASKKISDEKALYKKLRQLLATRHLYDHAGSPIDRVVQESLNEMARLMPGLTDHPRLLVQAVINRTATKLVQLRGELTC